MKLTHRWLRAGYTSLILIAFIAVGSLSTQAQTTPTPNPEVQKLKDQVRELEKMIEELKRKVDTVEQVQKQAPPVVPAQMPSGVPAAADTKVPAPAAAASKDDEDKSTLEIYGFAMLDTGYQFKQADPDWFDVLRVTKLPSFRDQYAPNGNWFTGVRQSRLGVKSTTPTKYGDLKTIFEFELLGSGTNAGDTTFKLRHAYGEIGHFGAGQYWSPFMDIDVFPNTIEYWGPTGMPIFRNVQVRWQPIQGRSFVTFAIERPGASGDQGRYADRVELDGVKPQFNVPDFSGNARLGRDWGYIQVGGIIRRMKWVDTRADAFDLGGSDVGWGLNFSSNIKFSKSTVGKFSFTHGEGIQNYMNDSPIDVGIKLNPGNVRRPVVGVALPITGVVAYVDHQWNDKFSSSGGYSYQNNQNSDGQAGDAFRSGHYASANLLWYPAKNTMVGGELIYGRRNNFNDGFHSEDFRVQFSFKYNFSKVIKF